MREIEIDEASRRGNEQAHSDDKLDFRPATLFGLKRIPILKNRVQKRLPKSDFGSLAKMILKPGVNVIRRHVVAHLTTPELRRRSRGNPRERLIE